MSENEATRTEGREPTSTGASVQLIDVTKRFADVVAVDDVSLEIRRGEFMTLLGPSGSGKTTILNMIAGFILPTAGNVMVGDADMTRVPPYKRNVGMVFQNYALFPHMRVFENIAFPLQQRKVPKRDIETRVHEALEIVQLRGLGKRYPRELSGGQQQRVALARAIVFNPRVLLMDEPLGALDKKLREHLQLEMKGIHLELGITFIHVTHDQEESLVMSDRITVIHDGNIQQVGTTEDIYERPATLFVAEFIGDSNVFRGQTERDGDRVALRSDELALALPSDDGARPGVTAALVIRPERLRLESPDDQPRPSDWTAFEGIVAQVVYLGNARRFEVELPGGKRMIVRGDPGENPFTAGDRVRVTWRVEDGILLEAEAVNVAETEEAGLELDVGAATGRPG
jgi:putative spermidine/putrescine transport system ATP-binding protein